MPDKKNNGTTELRTFLPDDNPKQELTTKYKVQVLPKDVETATSLTDPDHFDPFAARNVESATSDGQTLTHLLKASLGTGILSMPLAFQQAGLVFGIFATMFVSLVCTHCSYILVKSAHVLYRKTKKTQMSYADVGEATFATGPKRFRMLAVPSRYFIQISLFVTYYLTCSAYSVIIAGNFRDVIVHHFYPGTYSEAEITNQLRIIIACLLLPIILLTWVPNLKLLAPISMVANLFMALGLGITFYYIFADLPSISERKFVPSDIKDLSLFLSLTIFALEAIGVVMPLENNMRTPQNFIGIFGVMNKGMGAVTIVYIFLGFFGYMTFEEPKVVITQNLDITKIPAQAVRILIGLAVYCTFGLQFFVCLDIAWAGLKDRFTKKPLLYNYILRTVMVVGCISIAIAVPKIDPLVGIVGAFCFSILGVLVPIILEMIVFWDVGFGRFNWIIVKNILFFIVGILALIFGTKKGIEDLWEVLYPNEK